MGYLQSLVASKTITLTVARVNEEGFVNVNEIKSAHWLVTIMHANNEIGTIQPLREIANHIKQFNSRHRTDILLHSDGAQSLGKVSLSVVSSQIDMLSIVGHKFGAPKGVGALYIREGIHTCSMLIGGGQERGVRAGTESVPMIVALGEACRLANVEAAQLMLHFQTLRLLLVEQLQEAFKDHLSKVRFNGPSRCNNIKDIAADLKMLRALLSMPNTSSTAHREDLVEQLPNTVSVSFQHACAGDLLKSLSDKVAFSAGSACHSADPSAMKISDVLTAMKVPLAFAMGTMRLSFGRHTTEDDIRRAVKHIKTAVFALWMRDGRV